jgi:hypothetical protein
LWERLSAAMDEVDRFRMKLTRIYQSETPNTQLATREPFFRGAFVLNSEHSYFDIVSDFDIRI